MSKPTDLLEQYAAAVYAKDVDAVMELYDRDARVFDLWTQWQYPDKRAWRVAVTEWLTGLEDEFLTMKFDDVRVSTSSDLAVLHAIVTHFTADARGEQGRAMQYRLTWTLERKGHAWRIVHEHTSAPVDADTYLVILRQRI
jgi:uncharacterized protein (TIGR02246 family)